MTKQSFKYKQQICFDGVRGPFYSLAANINTNGFGLQVCPWGDRQSQEYRCADYIAAELPALQGFAWCSGKLESHLISEKQQSYFKCEWWSRKVSRQYLNKKIVAVL